MAASRQIHDGCPFYGMQFYHASEHVRELRMVVIPTERLVVIPTHGNQCALMTETFAPCVMEVHGLQPHWKGCPRNPRFYQFLDVPEGTVSTFREPKASTSYLLFLALGSAFLIANDLLTAFFRSWWVSALSGLLVPQVVAACGFRLMTGRWFDWMPSLKAVWSKLHKH
jgi:hypothetical protein